VSVSYRNEVRYRRDACLHYRSIINVVKKEREGGGNGEKRERKETKKEGIEDEVIRTEGNRDK
jgi:hypothetical protein